MANLKISALSALAGADVAPATDVLPIVDTSATTTMKIVVDELGIALNATQAEVDAGTDTKGLIPSARNKISQLTLAATTSGTEFDFTIPAGCRQVTVMFYGVSTNSTSAILIQLGDSGGIETTGYLSCATTGVTNLTSTAGFALTTTINASGAIYGAYTLSLVDAATFKWVGCGSLMDSSAQTNAWVASGGKATSAATTTVRITTVSGDTFDAGAVNVNYIR